mgnify:CR=1 FL=1
MLPNKIEENVQKALKDLESALDAYFKKRIDEAKLKVWKASSEIEYLLFLLEFSHNLKNPVSDDTLNNQNEELDMAESIVKAQELLQDALKFCEEKNLKKAHEKIWVARGYLIILQERIERGNV